MSIFLETFKHLVLGALIAGSFYGLPYLIKKGWEDGRNASAKNAKVCDVCFRNIVAWNARTKEKLNDIKPK